MNSNLLSPNWGGGVSYCPQTHTQTPYREDVRLKTIWKSWNFLSFKVDVTFEQVLVE